VTWATVRPTGATRWPVRTRLALLAALSVLPPAALFVGITAHPPVAGAATGAGEVITKVGTLKPLTSGSSATPYGVALPDGASCPGDTAHDGYHVFSYLVPKGTSPADVRFTTGLPDRGLGYFSSGAYFGAVNTAETTGQVVGIPTSFTWTRLTPGELFPDGTRSSAWEGGIACADIHGVVTDYWNSEIVFTADASVPGGFTWKVVGQGAISSPTDVGLWVGIALLVVASGAGAYALAQRHRLRQGAAEGAAIPVTDRERAGGPGPAPEPEPAGKAGP